MLSVSAIELGDSMRLKKKKKVAERINKLRKSAY